jgi:hypothetical protein
MHRDLRYPFGQEQYKFQTTVFSAEPKLMIYQKGNNHGYPLALGLKTSWHCRNCPFIKYHVNKWISKEQAKFIYDLLYDNTVSCEAIMEYMKKNKPSMPMEYTCYDCDYLTVRPVVKSLPQEPQPEPQDP